MEKYKCGHEIEHHLFLKAKLHPSAEKWVTSVGARGDKTKCWNCYSKVSGDESNVQ